MAGMRGIMGIVSLILISGALVLMFFVVLSGVTNSTPLNKTYFLQADTSKFSGSGRAISQWTYFYVCGADNTDCGAAVPALPFGYAWIGGTSGVPAELVGSYGKNTTSKYYYYIWRFGWVLYLLGLVFTVFAFFAALLAPCSRLASGLSGAILIFALFWYSLGVSLMTVEFVKARNAFTNAGIDASLGKYAFGFSWGAWAAIFLATIFLFMGCGAGGRNNDKARSTKASGGLFGRNRSRKPARGSFVDNESQRRVKDEYA